MENKNIPPFIYYKGSKKLLSAEELDNMAKVVMQTMPKAGLLNRATYLASKGVIPLKAISNRKKVDNEAIMRAYRKAIEYDDTAFDEVAGNIVMIMNNSRDLIEGEGVLDKNAYDDEGEKYTKLLGELNQLLYVQNLRWFLVITGHVPTEKQEKLIEEYAEKHGDNDDSEGKE